MNGLCANVEIAGINGCSMVGGRSNIYDKIRTCVF